MSAKTIFVLCASALLVQSISAQLGCGCGGYNGANIAAAELALAGASLGGYGGYGSYGCGIGAPVYAPVASASGGGLAVSSASPFAPNGISVVSENAIEGILAVNGQLPLLAAVAFEGNLPTAGAAGTAYSCGNGNVGITGESLAEAGIGAGAYGLGAYGAGLGGYGAGLGAYGAGLGLANAGLINAGAINAEIAGINAGLYGAGIAGSRIGGCGCGNIYY